MKANLRFRQWQAKLLGCALLMMVFAICAQGQEGEKKVLDGVPEQLRARLVERLKLYVEYERTKNYEKLYDLLLESVSAQPSLDRKSYVEVRKKALAKGHNVLLKFKPTWVVDLSDDKYGVVRFQIFGLTKIDTDEGISERESAVSARWTNGDWYFSTMADVIDN